MHTSNVTLQEAKVKGPFSCRSVAVESAKADKDCIAMKAFTLIKCNGAYDYVCGRKNILMSNDIPMADYYINMQGEWRHITR